MCQACLLRSEGGTKPTDWYPRRGANDGMGLGWVGGPVSGRSLFEIVVLKIKMVYYYTHTYIHEAYFYDQECLVGVWPNQSEEGGRGELGHVWRDRTSGAGSAVKVYTRRLPYSSTVDGKAMKQT